MDIDSKYTDILERALYNNTLAGLSRDGDEARDPCCRALIYLEQSRAKPDAGLDQRVGRCTLRFVWKSASPLQTEERSTLTRQ